MKMLLCVRRTGWASKRTFVRFLLPLPALLLSPLFFTPPVLATPHAHWQVTNQNTAGALLDLAQEKPLLQKVSITAPGLPLSEILKNISAQYHVSLGALLPVSDQRFTIVTQELPLHILMQQIVKTLSHEGDSAINGLPEYEWRKIKGKEKEQYLLVSLVPETVQRRKATAAGKERMRVLLREMRDLLKLPEQEAKRSKNASHFIPEILDRSDSFFSVYQQAIRSLSDRDIDALVRGDDVPVLPALLKDAVNSYDRDTQDNYVRAVERRKEGQPLPAAPVPTPIAALPYLRLRPDDWHGMYPGGLSKYAVWFEGIFEGQGISIDPYFNAVPPLVSPGRGEVPLDLMTVFPALENTPEKKIYQVYMPDTLVTLARAAKINVVQEQFYKVNALNSPIRNVRFKPQKEKLTTVLNDMCRVWNYTAVKDGEVYRLWSPTWPVDGECDVSERKLAPWRKLVARQGKLTVDDQVRLATEFTWGQVVVTVEQVLFPIMTFDPGDAFPFLGEPEQYCRLRLQGLLNPQERQAATSKEGIPVAALRPELRDEALQTILVASRTPLVQSKIDGVRARLATARLFLKPPPPDLLIPVPWSIQILDAPK